MPLATLGLCLTSILFNGHMGGATGGCGGSMSPSLLGPGGRRGVVQ